MTTHEYHSASAPARNPHGVAARYEAATTALGGKVTEYRTFLNTAFREPRMVGAATPTSSAVADTIAQVVPTTGSPVVVELGPGTGSISAGIHRRLPRGARHIGIELGADMVTHLRENKPWMEVVHGDASELRSLLEQLDITRADAVVSSIPWSLLDPQQQQRILAQATATIGEQGVFTALTYLPAAQSTGGRRFRERLDRTFDEVLTHTTWRNLPPILHYLCRRPLT